MQSLQNLQLINSFSEGVLNIKDLIKVTDIRENSIEIMVLFIKYISWSYKEYNAIHWAHRKHKRSQPLFVFPYGGFAIISDICWTSLLTSLLIWGFLFPFLTDDIHTEQWPEAKWPYREDNVFIVGCVGVRTSYIAHITPSLTFLFLQRAIRGVLDIPVV